MIYLFILSLIPVAAMGRTISSDFNFSSRYDNIDRGKVEERIQQRLKLYSDIGLTRKLHFKFLFSSGWQYRSSWNTVKSLSGNEQESQIYNLRRLYGDYQFDDKHSFQLGIIPPYVSQARTNIVTDGWVEGIQFKRKTERFSGYLAAGSIDDIDHPGIIHRTRSLNFGKLKGLYHFPGVMRFALGGIQLERDRYIQWGVRNSPLKYPYSGLTFTFENLINTETSAKNYSFSLTIKPLEFIREELKDYLRLELSQFQVDRDIGTLGTLTDDFYAFGSTRFFGAGGKITPKGNLNWFMEQWDNEIPRFKFGIVYRYQWDEKEF